MRRHSPWLSSVRLRTARLAVAALVTIVAVGDARADEAGVATYLRTDTDDTLVVAPRIRATGDIGEETSVSLVYAVDIWTSASIDIMTSASKTPVTEQRDEVDLSVDQIVDDFTFTAAYRYSSEPDYKSHGLSGGFSYEFAQKNSTLALGLSGSSDDVGRAGDPGFSRSVGTFGARVSFTQILDPEMLVQLIYELSRTSGYLASPYRFVAIGGDGTCDGTAPLCVPEVAPDTRLRHAAALYGRRALGDEWSAGLGYRYYTDAWGITAHTLRLEATYLPAEATLVTFRYRFYTQNGADHYRARYEEVQPFVTSDKELSPLSSHRIELELEQGIEFRDARAMTLVLSVSPLFYSYRDFVPLDSITAFEANAALQVTL